MRGSSGSQTRECFSFGHRSECLTTIFRCMTDKLATTDLSRACVGLVPSPWYWVSALSQVGVCKGDSPQPIKPQSRPFSCMTTCPYWHPYWRHLTIQWVLVWRDELRSRNRIIDVYVPFEGSSEVLEWDVHLHGIVIGSLISGLSESVIAMRRDI